MLFRSATPSELVITGAWMASRVCRDEQSRKSPCVWVKLIRECIDDLKMQARETELVQAIGISTTFPGVFPILSDASIDPRFVSLYDNTDDVGICDGRYEDLLARAEADTLVRMWPGNMAIGLIHLVRSAGLDLNDAAAIVPRPSTRPAIEQPTVAQFVVYEVVVGVAVVGDGRRIK